MLQFIDAGTVLRFLNYAESPYKAPPEIQELENQGLRGHTVLIKGVHIGLARVRVQLAHPAYKSEQGFCAC